MVDPVTAIDASQSLLPKLEPIAGAALALNLAYLNLERFRYRKRIREYARKKHKDFIDGTKNITDRQREGEYYKNLAYLAALEDTEFGNPFKRFWSWLTKTPRPPGVWGRLYFYLFGNHADLYFSGTMAVIAAFMLMYGVAHSIDYLSYSVTWFVSSNISYSFYMLVVAAAAPLALVFLGLHVVSAARKHTKKCVKELEIYLQDEAQKAELRED